MKENQTINFTGQMIEVKENDIKKMTSDNVGLNEDKARLELEITELEKVRVELEKRSH